MNQREFFDMADSLEISTDELSEKFDKAHDKLRAYANENGYKYNVSVENGEVELEFTGNDGEESNSFVDDAQALFDQFFA